MDNSNAKQIFFLYARKSSEGEDRQVQSIDDQVNRLNEMVQNQNIIIKRVFTEAKTAKKPYCRPVFAEMIKRLEKGEADGIVCWKLDRLARNPIDGGSIMWMLQSNIIKQIKTIDRTFYPSDNVLMMSVEFGMANQYIIDMKKNIMRGMDSRAEKGNKSGIAPVGYINDRVEKLIKPDPERFDLVRKIWDMMLTGNYTPQKIRNIVNKEWGFRTRKIRLSGNKEISMSAIYTLFDNEFYMGLFRWKGKLYRGNHTPMITVEEFDRVQTILKRRNIIRPQQHNFAYTGLIRCLECNMMVTATEKLKLLKTTGVYSPYVYYHCTRKSKDKSCFNPPVTMRNLEEQISLELESYTVAPEFLEWTLEYLDSEKAKISVDMSQAREMQQKSIETLEKELENLTKMRYRDMIDDALFAKESAELKDKITKLTLQLNTSVDNTPQWIELTKKAFHFATYALPAFKNGTPEQQREIVAAFGSNYGIKDKILIFKASFWLTPIKTAHADLMTEFNRLELQKCLDNEGWNALLSPLFLKWCTIVEDVRTAIERNNDTTLHIPLLEKPLEKESKLKDS